MISRDQIASLGLGYGLEVLLPFDLEVVSE